MTEISGLELAAMRKAKGLTQRELALLVDISQPNIAAYETGRRAPSPATAKKLYAALRPPLLEYVRSRRDEIIALAARRDLHNVRVFGSAARGEDGPDSDVDFLVHPGERASLWDLAGFWSEVSEMLGVETDVVSDGGRSAVLDHIMSEAVPL